jgi:hypothetical protein
VQMAGNLSWSEPLMSLDKGHQTDPALLAELMQSNNYSSDFLQRYQNAKRVLAKAPNLREAQASVAYYTSFILDALPIDQRVAAVADARHAFDKARELDPQLGDIEGAWCSLHSDALFRDCEDHLRAGIARSPDDNWLNEYLAERLEEVGRFDEAVQLRQLSYTQDPYVPFKIGYMLQTLEFTGATSDANALNQNGDRWWPEFKPSFVRHRLFGLLDRGDFHGIARLALHRDVSDSPPLRAIGAIISAIDSKSVPQLRQACVVALGADPKSGPELLMIECLAAFNALGDDDDVYALADKLYPRRIGRAPSETEQIWLDDPGGGGSTQFVVTLTAAPMRRDPRFIPLAQRTGLLDYWRSGRAPDFCKRPHYEPVCKQLLNRR